MKKYLFPLLIIIGALGHLYFALEYKVLNNADDFAYLQMAEYFKNFDLRGFGTGWFGFLYSLPIALFSFILGSTFVSAIVVNALLFSVGAILLYQLSKKILPENFGILAVSLYYISPFLLGFNIHILSENLFIVLFLWLLLNLSGIWEDFSYKKLFIVAINLALLYFTRAESFIYVGSVGLYMLIIWFHKKFYFSELFKKGIFVLASFFLLISPYIFYLYTFTGEIGLTNKGASNFRQAEMRGIEKQDDEGFEKAVGELTPDNKHLIAGFAGGLDYEKPNIEGGVLSEIMNSPKETLKRWGQNQIKVFTNAIPRTTIGEGLEFFTKENSPYFKSKTIILGISGVVLLVFAFGVFSLFKNKNYSLGYPYLITFFTAFLFFTIFFVILRYFVIFVPLFFVVFLYGVQNLVLFFKEKVWIKIITGFLILFLTLMQTLGCYSYVNNLRGQNEYYSLKKIAGEYLKNNYYSQELKVMERFPIVTYYSGTLKRILTPYTDKIENLYEYAKYNKVDFLIVDTMDFKTYRPELEYLLDTSKKPDFLEVESIFRNGEEKVIVYKFLY